MSTQESSLQGCQEVKHVVYRSQMKKWNKYWLDILPYQCYCSLKQAQSIIDEKPREWDTRIIKVTTEVIK